MERVVVYTAVDVRCCVQRNVFFFLDVYLLRYFSSSTPPVAQSIVLSFLSLLTIEFDPMIHFPPLPPHFAFLFLPPYFHTRKMGGRLTTANVSRATTSAQLCEEEEEECSEFSGYGW